MDDRNPSNSVLEAVDQVAPASSLAALRPVADPRHPRKSVPLPDTTEDTMEDMDIMALK